MKRYLTMLLIISLCIFVFTGCSKKIEDLSSTNKIEITKFSTTSDNDNVYSVTVDNDEQVKYICDNLNSLTMKKMGYNKPTEKAYTLTFYSSARKIQTISITAHGWIDYNGDFHNVVDGKLDIDYIDSLLKDATPSNGDNEVPNDPPNKDVTNDNTYIVMEVTENNFVVAEIGENGKAIESKQYSVPNWFYPSTEIKVGYEISITHNGSILETFPMQFGEIYKMEYYDKEIGLLTTVIPE